MEFFSRLGFRVSLLVAVLLYFVSATAQEAVQQDTANVYKQDHVYKQGVTPMGLDCYYMAAYYYNNEVVYNLRGYPMCYTFGNVVSIKVNPSGTSYAVLSKKKSGKSRVRVYDLWEADYELHSFGKVEQPTAICYTTDAKNLVIANMNEIQFYDARTFKFVKKFPATFAATEMRVSPNIYFLAVAGENKVQVWNLETGKVRTELAMGAKVNALSFSADNKLMAVATADGKVYIYDTQSFALSKNYEGMGEALSCDFHPNGKYFAVVESKENVRVINLLDKEEGLNVLSPAGGISQAVFVNSSDDKSFLVHNTTGNITYSHMAVLSPHYRKMLAEELDKCMNEWLKQMPGESFEDYELRVTDENRKEQMRLFEQEISTRLAEGQVEMSDVSLGKYNPENNMLTVNFNNMPSIFLTVPSNEVNDFMDADNLEFRNAKYGLTEDDNFELIYADVYNTVSGKSYVYNNLNRAPLEFLTADDNFVPLELVQQSNMEEMQLQKIKQSVMESAKSENVISDHTSINVSSKVVADVDADGNKIMNYVVDVSYEVQMGFSIEEDFGPGRFKVEESGAAMSMLRIIKQAFEGDLAQYVKEGRKWKVKVTGMADALPIARKIPYDGCYGEYRNEPVYKGKELSNITLTKEDGITKNEQLAMLRALGVSNYVNNNINGISKMNADYEYYIEISEEKGGEYRRINLEMIFIDAL